MRLMYGDADPFLIEFSASYFSVGTQEFCQVDKMISLLLTDMIPGENLISGIVSKESNMQVLRLPKEVVCLGSEEYLDWLKINLNAAKIDTVENYKQTKNYYEWTCAYTVLKLTVKQVIYGSM